MLRVGDRALVEYYGDGELVRREYYEDPGMERNLLWSGLSAAERPAWDVIRPMVVELRAMRQCAGTEEQDSPEACP
jgi:hypothetical protein